MIGSPALKKDDSMTSQLQTSIFHPIDSANLCQITAVCKRRDGGTKYWCLQHKADATAKYGVPAEKCRYAHVEPISAEDTLSIDISDHNGCIGLWGAVPPLYDTTNQPLDQGIHVHVRNEKGGPKVIDKTYRQVNLSDGETTHEISELDAIYFMVSSVFNYDVHFITCTRCQYPHLDKDWFSVHPHKVHLCSGCGRSFHDNKIAIGNPVATIKNLPIAAKPKFIKAQKKLNISQEEFEGGIQIWGSNPAILWTSDKAQETGIHVHGFRKGDDSPSLDDTYSEVIIDGIELDGEQIRIYMAQRSLPHIEGRIKSITCQNCKHEQFDTDKLAFSPTVNKHCNNCGEKISPEGRLRKVIANPVIARLEKIAQVTSRPLQTHDLKLIPESI